MTTLHTVEIDYTNWRGERRKRVVAPVSLEIGSNKWHPEKQWLLYALDMEDKKLKTFAMSGVHGWTPQDAQGTEAPEDAPGIEGGTQARPDP